MNHDVVRLGPDELGVGTFSISGWRSCTGASESSPCSGLYVGLCYVLVVGDGVFQVRHNLEIKILAVGRAGPQKGTETLGTPYEESTWSACARPQ